MSLTFEGDGTISGFDSGLSGFGGLVAVKHAIFTGTQTASLAAGANVAVTDLSITHEVADASNKLIISAFLGAVGSSLGVPKVGLSIHDGTALIAVGDADGSANRVTVGGQQSSGSSAGNVNNLAFTIVHTPGSGSKTYTVRVTNVRTDTRTIYINRPEDSGTTVDVARTVSSLVIQEVSV